MGIIGKIVSTIATNSIIKTAGETTLITTGAIIDKVDKHKQNVNKNNSKPIQINVFTVNDYIGENYLDAYNHIIGLGFSNVTLVPEKDLINGWLTKDGTVEDIVIGGISEFKRKTQFSPDTPVMITYHTLKNSTASITKSSQQADNNTIASPLTETTIAISEAIECPNCSAKLEKNSKFCSECGAKIEIKKASFCGQCGKPLITGAKFCANCGAKV